MLYFSQKRWLFIVGTLVALLSLFVFYVQPTIKGITGLEDRIARKERELEDIVSLGRELLKVKRELSVLEVSAIGREEKESLTPILSELAARAGTKGNLSSVESKQRGLSPGFWGNEVVIRFSGISWERLKDFLADVEDYQDILHLKRVSFKARYDNPKLLDSTVVIFVLERK